MQTTKTSDWMQLAGVVGVIAGLLMVAYEVRQANVFAEAEAVRSFYEGWDSFSMSSYETDIYDVYVKSFENPEDLTSAEILKLDAWLVTAMTQYMKFESMQNRGLMPLTNFDELILNFDLYFGSRFARAWYRSQKGWIVGRLAEIIDREIEVRPPRSSIGLVEEIRLLIRDGEP